MCQGRVARANPLLSVCRALSHPTAPASRKKAVRRQRNLGLAKNKIWHQIISKFINLALARATRAAATLVFC